MDAPKNVVLWGCRTTPSLTAAANLAALERLADLSTSFSNPAAHMTANLVELTACPEVVIPGGPANDFLRNAFDFLPDPLDFLLGRAAAQFCHSVSSSAGRISNFVPSNARPQLSRLTSQQT